MYSPPVNQISSCTLIAPFYEPMAVPPLTPNHPPLSATMLSLASWTAFISVMALELNRYSPQARWLVRFPLMLIFAGELAKLRWGQHRGVCCAAIC